MRKVYLFIEYFIFKMSKEELDRLTKENEQLNRDMNDMSGSLGTKADGDVSDVRVDLIKSHNVIG